MAAGRPTLYREEYCVKAVDLMRQGASKIEVAAEIGVNVDTIYEWAKVHPDFSDALKKGSDLSQAWWEKQGRIALREDKFNSALWYMNMKNRFHWTDKQEQKIDANVNLNQVELMNRARQRVKDAAPDKQARGEGGAG